MRAPVRPGVVREPGMCGSSFAREPGGLGFGLRLDAAGPHWKDEES